MVAFDDIDFKKMFGYPCCFCNGNMFTGLHEENWVVRLPEEARSEIMQSYGAKQFQPMPNRTMKEYVILPNEVLSCAKTLKSWLAKSLEYAQSLPAK